MKGVPEGGGAPCEDAQGLALRQRHRRRGSLNLKRGSAQV